MMKRRRLWSIVLISGLGVLLLTTAKPVGERVTNVLLWEHVNKTCRERDCDDAVNYEQLSTIQSNMNPAANPCDSFHTYACGNWRRKNPNGTTMVKYGYDQMTAKFVKIFEGWLNEQAMKEWAGVRELRTRRTYAEQNLLPETKQLAEIKDVTSNSFENPTNFGSRSETLNAARSIQHENSFTSTRKTLTTTLAWHHNEDIVSQKLLKYYKACKTEHAQSTLRSYFEATKSHINWQLEDYDWLDSLAQLGRFGFSANFLTMNVVNKNTSLHRIMIRPHELDAPLSLNSEISDILGEFTNRSHNDLQKRFNELEADLQQLNCQYCEFASAAAASEDDYEDEDECDCYKVESMTFAKLNAQLPEIDWQRYLSVQLGGRQVAEHEIIEIANLELIKLQLSYVRQLDADVSLTYTLARFLTYINEQRQDFFKNRESSHNCLHHMRKLFYIPMVYLYERAQYSTRRAESEKVVNQIFKELKTQFALIIQQNKMQFTSTVLDHLLSKLTHLKINLGNLPKNVSTQFFYDYVTPYNFTDNFHSNHLHALEVFYKQYNALLDVGENELQDIWHTFNIHQPHFPDNLDATPYYYARSNLIVIPYAYLQMPFYDANFWPAMLYGDLANTLGHELIHAFDTEFLKYDSNGNPYPQPAASMFKNPLFCRNLACLQRGTEYVRERIADVSGARLALNTFQSLDPYALERNGELYFLQFSQFFCGAADPVTFKEVDPLHDVDNQRLDYVLGMLPEFARVFHCPLGSTMNPHDKCEMYT